MDAAVLSDQDVRQNKNHNLYQAESADYQTVVQPIAGPSRITEVTLHRTPALSENTVYQRIKQKLINSE